MPDLDSEQFRAAGHALVDWIADFYAGLPDRPVNPRQSPADLQALLPADGLPESGLPGDVLLAEIAPLLFDYSVHNGHPRFFGYITASGSPLGALGDLLAAAVNPNLARWDCSGLPTEIETQTVRWLADLIGFPVNCSGIMTSGGNMANFLAFVAARKAKADWDVRNDGLTGGARLLTAYVSAEAHTWVDKAADVAGLGANAIRWIAVDSTQRLLPDALTEQIAADRRAGCHPFLVVGTAGTTGTGAVDPLNQIAEIARREDLWFHVDGAYGAPVAALPDAPADFNAFSAADSVAIDPHKWLYAPLEAGCTLVRDPAALEEAFSFLPSYYRQETIDGEVPPVNFYNLGMQNSRGFRALKVWLGLRATGRQGVIDAIQRDIRLSKRLHESLQAHEELQACTQNLSINTFRFRPRTLPTTERAEDYLDQLNRRLLTTLRKSGELYLSNAMIDGHYWLRSCIVNFRVGETDVDAIPTLVARHGQELDAELRPDALL
jgi:glutamate/tyrosine decarboxylase-like PLP-dependent enzyme